METKMSDLIAIEYAAAKHQIPQPTLLALIERSGLRDPIGSEHLVYDDWRLERLATKCATGRQVMAPPAHKIDQALVDRIVARVEKRADGCWEWKGAIHTSSRYPAGQYGMMKFGGKNRGVHRIMWTAIHGQIPAGMSICHTCDFPACVNPDHLWLGTHAENMADMNAKGRNASANQTHCKNGHPFDAVNTYRMGNKRYCRTCVREAGRRYYRKRATSNSTGVP